MRSAEAIPAGNATLSTAVLGGAIAASALPGLVCNCLVGLSIVSGGLLRGSRRGLYEAVAALLLCDSVQLLNLFGIGVASAAQDILVPPWAYRVPGFLFLWMWQESWLLLSFIALNRYLLICQPSRVAWLSDGAVVRRLMATTWLVSLGTVSVSQILLPCCRFVVLPQAFTVSWLGPATAGGDARLWSDWLVEWPGNSATTLVLVASYAAVLRTLSGHREKVARALAKEATERRRRQELRLAFQFMAISLFFILCTIIFRIFPLIVPKGKEEFFGTLSFFLVMNSSINAFVYVSFNLEVRVHLKRLLCLHHERCEVTATGLVEGVTWTAENHAANQVSLLPEDMTSFNPQHSV